MQELIIKKYNNIETVDSRIVAEELGIEHRALIQLIRTHQESIESNFERVAFEMLPSETAGGIQNLTVAHLSEDQALFIGSLSRNTQKVVDFKSKLVKAFSLARKPITVFYFTHMNELIKVSRNENEQQVVSARELYEFLEIKEHFTQWIERMFEYGFSESIDYQAVKNFVTHSNGVGGTYKTDYVLTLDTSKEIAMLQRSEKGKQARQYFIECEKKLKEQVPSYLIKDEIERAKAWIIEAEERKQLQEQNKAL